MFGLKASRAISAYRVLAALILLLAVGASALAQSFRFEPVSVAGVIAAASALERTLTLESGQRFELSARLVAETKGESYRGYAALERLKPGVRVALTIESPAMLGAGAPVRHLILFAR
jgi:hypothetical protein